MKIVIAYGTETFNAEGLAHETQDILGECGFDAEVLDLADFDASTLRELKVLLLITSTFGDGEPPSNAEYAYDLLMSDDAPKMSGVDFSVCALGDSDYEHFCQCGKDFDHRMEVLGGRRIAKRFDCDTDYEKPWSDWVDTVIDALKMQAPKGSTQAEKKAMRTLKHSGVKSNADLDDRPSVALEQAPEPVISSPKLSGKQRDRAVGTRANPYFTKVLGNRNLNHPFSDKETRHIVLALNRDDVTYQVGDVLGVFPRNCPDLVRRILDAVNLSRDESVQYEGDWYPLRDVLLYKTDLTQIDRRMLKLASLGRRGTHIAALLNDRKLAREYIGTHHLIDLLAESQCRPGHQEFIAALRPLAPRLYSIASSPNYHPDEVHLTVDVLRYTLHGTMRKGCSSSFLGERASEGVEVAVYVQPTKDFVLCDDDLPIIMVGPGTGVAPFRAFLAEREFRDAPGQSWLFFGAQRSGRDFLYRDELTTWKKSGRLVRLDTAFSRDQKEKLYVQHRLYEHRRSIYHWLESGAFIYVCGDAKRMAKDVRAMFIRIVSEMKPCSLERAETYIAEMESQKRYLKDVY